MICPISMDDSVYGLSQWETALHFNVVSLWLSQCLITNASQPSSTAQAHIESLTSWFLKFTCLHDFFQWSHCGQKHICCHDLEFLLWKLLINLWFWAIFVINTLHHTRLCSPRESPVAREWDSVIFSRGLETCMRLCWEGQGGVQLWCETAASCFQRAGSRKWQVCCRACVCG